MVQKQRNKAVNERERKRRLQYKKAKIQRKRQRMLLLFSLELLCIFCMLSFLVGRKIGSGKPSEDKTFQMSEQNLNYMSSCHITEDGKLTNVMRGEEENYNLLLVNKDNKLPDDYEVELVTFEDGVKLAAKEAYEPLCDMLKAGRNEGLVFKICSAYRSTERQQQLFDEDVDALVRAGYSYSQAYEEVAKETMPPGYSEHSTGLAFDIVSFDYQILDERQKNTAENKWLFKHCAEYGFILRYPKEKEDITKISYEPWHFRYVGVEAATYIMENNLTLEEYLDYNSIF